MNNDFLMIVDKPINYTSRDVVNVVGKILNTKKVGHTGTLDPLATGVLVLTVGKATKLCDEVTSNYKEYEVTMELGYETDTLDIEGVKTKESNKKVSDDRILDVINSYVKKYDQEVPKYSAVKINGKKLYEYARLNIDVKLPKREVDIKSISNINIDGNIVSFTTFVSKGTYIRSLVRDIGQDLGTFATMTSLRRTVQGKFNIKDASNLQDIEHGNYKKISIGDALDDIIVLDIDDIKYKEVINGVKQSVNLSNKYILYTYKGKNTAIYKKDGNIYKMFIML